MPVRLGSRHVLVAALCALAFVPGSMSGVGAAATAEPLDVALKLSRQERGATLGVTRADVADLVVTSKYRSAAQRRHPRQPEPALPGPRGLRRARDRQRRPPTGASSSPAAASCARWRTAPSGTRQARADRRRSRPRPTRSSSSSRPTCACSAQASGPARETVVSAGGISDAPIPRALGWQPTANGLRMAWQLVIDDSSERTSGTPPSTPRPARCSTPTTGPSHDNVDDLATTLARSGRARRRERPRARRRDRSITPNPVIDGSSYRVFEFPKESPNDGPRTLVANPADATASPFGWHDTNGVARRRVHDHARQQRPRLPRPGRQQRAGLRRQPGRRRRARLRLPGRPRRARAELPRRRRRRTSSTCNNIDPRHPATRYGFDEAVGQLPGEQLRPRRPRAATTSAPRRPTAAARTTPTSRRPPSATTAGTPRMQMYLWPGNQFGAAEPGRRRRRRLVRRRRGRASSPAPTVAGHGRHVLSTPATAASPPTTPARRPATGSRSSPAATPAARTSTRRAQASDGRREGARSSPYDAGRRRRS